jgi:hypothetical protein
MHKTPCLPALSASVNLLGGLQNQKRWKHKMTFFQKMKDMEKWVRSSNKSHFQRHWQEMAGDPTICRRASARGGCVERIALVFFYRCAWVSFDSSLPMYLLHTKKLFQHLENGKRVFRSQDVKIPPTRPRAHACA